MRGVLGMTVKFSDRFNNVHVRHVKMLQESNLLIYYYVRKLTKV